MLYVSLKVTAGRKIYTTEINLWPKTEHLRGRGPRRGWHVKMAGVPVVRTNLVTVCGSVLVGVDVWHRLHLAHTDPGYAGQPRQRGTHDQGSELLGGVRHRAR